MIESLFVLLGLIVVVFFAYDIRRKSKAHQNAIQDEKNAIATYSRMTATMSTFADGKHTVALLAASEDCQLFFYRMIVDGNILLRYTLSLANIRSAALDIDGKKYNFSYPSSHKTAHMRATDIALQIRQKLPSSRYDAMQRITLNIQFLSENGESKLLPVHILKNPTSEIRKSLPKLLENAIWWQLYLTLITSSDDTLTLPPDGMPPID